ncbi:MAG: SDR family NAD(P)-dependent oxidoreductase [Sphingobacteriaceae bacterium]
METFKNKIALVTGGSRGIGAAIVKRLAQQGATVTFTYVNGKEQAQKLENDLTEKGLKAQALKADNSVSGELANVIDSIISQYGNFDILVNSAGIYIGKPFEEHTLEDYQKTFDINVRAVVEACIAAANKMNPSGRIITIGSCMADKVSFAQGTLYSMSKSALIGLTKGLARDLGPKKITVNLIQPGPINTDMNPQDSPSADFQRSLMAIPEFGKPEHIAGMVAYLANPETGYTTGGIFNIDGGTTS